MACFACMIFFHDLFLSPCYPYVKCDVLFIMFFYTSFKDYTQNIQCFNYNEYLELLNFLHVQKNISMLTNMQNMPFKND
jgi:hypothetical protein